MSKVEISEEAREYILKKNDAVTVDINMMVS